VLPALRSSDVGWERSAAATRACPSLAATGQERFPWDPTPIPRSPKATLPEPSQRFKFTVCVLNKYEPTPTRFILTISQVDVPIRRHESNRA
jgi:hypothetical protein